MTLFNRAIIGAIQTWDAVFYGYVRAWDEQLGRYYPDPHCTLTRWDGVERVVATATAVAWAAAMILSFI